MSFQACSKNRLPLQNSNYLISEHTNLGADRIATNGDAANKIGTFTHAVSARNAGIPFYVAAPISTFDPETSNGKEYVKGENVVDVWGGVADANSGKFWERDTLQLHFSTTKGLAAICAAMLYERGELDYETPVSHYWPEFAQGGKEKITVAQCMNHQAGLASVDAELTLDEICEKEPVLRALEKQIPLWEPGSADSPSRI